jgi:hypothetical protein
MMLKGKFYTILCFLLLTSVLFSTVLSSCSASRSRHRYSKPKPQKRKACDCPSFNNYKNQIYYSNLV